MKHGLMLALLGSSVIATPTLAQTTSPADDVVIMRRVLTKPARASNGANVPKDTSWLVGAWQTQTQGTCGVASQEVRPVQCVAGGKAVADAMCAGPKPEATRAVEGDQSSCYFNWVAGPWSDPVAACGASKQHRTMTCTSSTGNVVDDARCTTAKGATEQPSYDYSLCEYQWSVEGWGDWDSTCSSKARRMRPVYCHRADGGTVEDSACAGSGAKPVTMETAIIQTGCGYQWKTESWTPLDDNCTGTGQTRPVTCVVAGTSEASDKCDPSMKPAASRLATASEGCEAKNPDGTPQTYSWKVGALVPNAGACGDVPGTRTVSCVSSTGPTVSDDRCTEDKPASTGSALDYSTCTFGWVTDEWGGWTSDCSTAAVRAREVSCRRSDGSMVEEKSCDAASKPVTTEQGGNFTKCEYAWHEGDYGPPVPACGPTVRTLATSCRRSDGATVDDARCDAGTRPSAQQPASDYSTCTYAWAIDPWGEYTPTCSSAAVRTRGVNCMRSDGTADLDSRCTGPKPTGTESEQYYAGCTYEWAPTGWTGTGNGCGSYTQTETYACRRSDGATVPEANCTAPKPSNTRQQDDTARCSYAWTADAWTPWDSTCSAASSRNRDVACVRSDGKPAATPLCTGTKPGTVETAANYTGCTYAWKTGTWQQGNPSCGDVTQSRTVTCERQDGAAADASMCNAATRPSETQSALDLRACTYSWSTGTWGSYDNTCTSSANRTRAVTCIRSDGTASIDPNCTGTKPVTAETSAVYSGCSYAWAAESYGAWSSTCSSTATRTINWECQRSDGTYVTDASCTAAKPAGTSAPTNVATSCEQAVNGDFSNGLTGYYGGQGITVVDGGGGNMVAKFTTSGSAQASIARDYSIINGRTYKVHIEWTAAMTSGQCSSSSSFSNAVWRFPNGRSNPAQGNFFLDGQICGMNKYIKDYTFKANYTGTAQLVLWLAPPGTAQVTAYVDNISFYMVP